MMKVIRTMRYASIRKLDITNGEGVGVALFVQGCHFHCKNCFNSCTWDFDGGMEWNKKTKEHFLSLIDRDYIERVTILGGEPLANENVGEVYDIISTIREKYPSKKIWLYSGYNFSRILTESIYNFSFTGESDKYVTARAMSALSVDVMVDGLFVDELKDYRLHWRGSSNQRVINIKPTYDKYIKKIRSHRGLIYDNEAFVDECINVIE